MSDNRPNMIARLLLEHSIRRAKRERRRHPLFLLDTDTADSCFAEIPLHGGSVALCLLRVGHSGECSILPSDTDAADILASGAEVSVS